MSMYIWKVGLELQWKSSWKVGKAIKSYLWEEDDLELTVSAESGRAAILKAEKLAMSKEPWEGVHYGDDDSETPSTETPYKVLDVVSLELLQTLDG